MAVKITLKQLNELGACENQLKLFEETFGEEAIFKTKAQAVETAIKMARKFDFEWAAIKLLSRGYRKDYQETKAPLWEAYLEAKAPLRKAYKEAIAPLQQAYEEAIAKLFAELYFKQEPKGE